MNKRNKTDDLTPKLLRRLDQLERRPASRSRLIEELRIAAMEHDKAPDGGRSAVIGALQAVEAYLNARPYHDARTFTRPISNLVQALLDLAKGRPVPPMLRPPPTNKTKGLKGASYRSSTTGEAVRALSSFAVEMHMKDGRSEDEACRIVSRELARQGWQRSGDNPITANTVKNWRKRVKGGHKSEDADTGHFTHLIEQGKDSKASEMPSEVAKRALRWLEDRYPKSARKVS